MAVRREKVLDTSDPLNMLLNGVPFLSGSEALAEAAVEEKAPPVQMKAASAAAAPPSKPSIDPKPISTSQVNNNAVTRGSEPSAPQAAAATLSVPRKAPAPPPQQIEEDEEPMFGRAAPATTSQDSDIFKGASLPNKGSNVLRFGNERLDDDVLSDLNVNKLLEEEKDLDFELFGTSKVAMGGHIKSASKPATRIDILDDEDINSKIYELEIKEPDSNAFTASTSHYSAPSAAPSARAPEVTGDFDINAYIRSQAESDGGGLFD